MNEKEKSLKRAKGTAIKLADLGIKAAANAVLPGAGGIIYSLTKTVCTHASKFMLDRRDDRIHLFLEELLTKDKYEEREHFIEKEFSEEDFYSILANVIEDEEADKNTYYVNIFESIVYGKLVNPYKLHFIKAIRQLTCEDIELMRKVHVASNYRLYGQGIVEDQVNNILNTQSVVTNISIQNLARLGFVIRGTKIGEIDKHLPTELLFKFVDQIFYPYELVPESIGHKSWSGLRATIVCHDLTKYGPILDKLSCPFGKRAWNRVSAG